jgi:hypothetical protein
MYPTKSSAECAVHTLTELSKHEMFLEAFNDAEVICIILEVLGKGHAVKEVLVLLRWVLTFNKIAEEFTHSTGPWLLVNLLADDNRPGDVSIATLCVLRHWLDQATSPDAANTFSAVTGTKVCVARLASLRTLTYKRPEKSWLFSWLGLGSTQNMSWWKIKALIGPHL